MSKSYDLRHFFIHLSSSNTHFLAWSHYVNSEKPNIW